MIIAFLVGFLFALGLGISGMTNPEKVMGFLDVFGEWDPSLVFVMAGAIGVHFLIYRFFKKKNAPLLSVRWHLPTKTEITGSLIVGSFLFGIGWGLAGYCPGPAVVSTVTLNGGVFTFVTSMLVGMLLFKVVARKFGLR